MFTAFSIGNIAILNEATSNIPQIFINSRLTPQYFLSLHDAPGLFLVLMPLFKWMSMHRYKQTCRPHPSYLAVRCIRGPGRLVTFSLHLNINTVATGRSKQVTVYAYDRKVISPLAKSHRPATFSLCSNVNTIVLVSSTGYDREQLLSRVYFRGVKEYVHTPPSQLAILYLICCYPLLDLHSSPPPLKFATMCLPPLERNPEINPAKPLASLEVQWPSLQVQWQHFLSA